MRNKNLFIIGGEGLIGKSIVNYFLKNGWNVFSFDKIKPNKIKKKNYQFFEVDINQFSELTILLKTIFKKKIPDCFINASYPRTDDWAKNNFSDITYESFSKNIDLQLKSVCWLSKIFADQMQKRRVRGSIILLASMYGIVAHDSSVYKGTKMKENFTYTIIKGGIISSAKSLASNYGKYNIRVNAISPGAILGHVAGGKSNQPKNFIKNFESRVPLRRLSKPIEIAKAIYFLGSEESSYITGSNLVADGGWTII